LIFGPLLLQMIAQEQLNEHVEHKSLKLFWGFSCFIVQITRVILHWNSA
jgi:hypothetical protein